MSNTGSAENSDDLVDRPSRWQADDLCRPFVDLLPITGALISERGHSGWS